jgi:hypothetical protein
MGADTAAAKPVDDNLPIEEKLKKHIIDGEKRDLIQASRRGGMKYKPLADHQRSFCWKG